MKAFSNYLSVNPVLLFKFFFKVYRLLDKFDEDSDEDKFLKTIASIIKDVGLPLKVTETRVVADKDMLVLIPEGTVFLELVESTDD